LLLHGSIPETPTFIGYGVSLNYYLVEHKIYNTQKQVFTVFKYQCDLSLEIIMY